MYLKWEPVKNLVLETKNSAEAVFSEQRLYYSEKAGYDNIIQNIKNQIFQLTTSNTANYANVFGGYHSFRALVGQEATKYIQSQDYYVAYGVNPEMPYPNTADQTKTEISTGITRDAMLSFFGIVDYNYDNKYFLQGTVRQDGSSLFGAKNKWGLFYSGSASWNISNEKFMADYKNVVDLLKVRASYGLNGNNGIAAYRAYGVYSTAMYNGISGMLPSRPENQELSWEKNATWNVGLDFGFYNRVRGSVDVYERTTLDMLLNKAVPQTSGFSSNFMNTGSMRNYGVEFQFDADLIASNDCLWNVGFNVAKNRTEILDLGGEDVIQAASYMHYKVGNSLYSYYLSDYYGVNPSNGEALWVTEDGKLTNDYNQARKYYAGSPEPKLVGGFNSTFAYKGFSIGAFFEYKYGNKILPMNECRYLMSDGAQMNMNQMASALNYWKKPGDTGVNPKPIAGNATNSATALSDRWLERGDYLRIKDVTLSYSLPKVALDKIHVKGLRFFVSGLNLYCFNDVNFWDPEMGVTGTGAGVYPLTKSFVGGIELSF
jgi:TonB-linked SusC/RagA family outer membrane protein